MASDRFSNDKYNREGRESKYFFESGKGKVFSVYRHMVNMKYEKIFQNMKKYLT
jgi:hypothetical protein